MYHNQTVLVGIMSHQDCSQTKSLISGQQRVKERHTSCSLVKLRSHAQVYLVKLRSKEGAREFHFNMEEDTLFWAEKDKV